MEQTGQDCQQRQSCVSKLSHAVRRFLLVRREEKKSFWEVIYLALFCLLLATNTFQADIIMYMNFVWWLYATSHLFWQGKSNCSYSKLGELYNKLCRSDVQYGRCFHFELKEKYSNVPLKTFCLWNSCFKTNYSLMQSASYCFCVSISLCVCFAKIQHLQ